jgi:hypothetical protein
VRHFTDAREHAADARRRQRSGSRELDQQDLLDLSVPSRLRPASEVMAREQPGLVVVRPEVRGSGMRDVDGNHRNARLVVARGNRRSHRFVGLKLDDEVDAFADEELRILQRYFGLISVVDDDQLDLLPFRSP